MGNRWFRFYDEALDDPKVQRLSPILFKTWVNVLCAASRHSGLIPSVADLAFLLRRDETELASEIEALKDAGLIDEARGKVTPHNWNGRQFQSDGSTERVKRFRKRHDDTEGNVSETANETPPETEADSEQSRTETEQILEEAAPPEKRNAPKVSKGTRIPEDFVPDYGEALVVGLSLTEAMTEAANFKDYWKAKPGEAGEKLDWPATWRLWCRKAAKDRKTGGSAPMQPTTPSATPTVWINEDDPRFKPLSDRYAEETGKVVVARGSRYEAGIGSHFPAGWVAPKPSVAA